MILPVFLKKGTAFFGIIFLKFLQNKQIYAMLIMQANRKTPEGL
jgi:hypothetical protein